MTKSSETGMGVQRIPELDGLRGLAICLVFIGHFGTFSARSSGLWTAFAEVGVLLFFVLSGFLITSLLCAEERSHQQRVNLRYFYVRRALRLLPAAWTFISITALLKVSGLVTDESWGGIGASLLYVRNIFGRGTTLGHLWSLSLEEQFYFIWPLLFVVFPKRRLGVALTVVGVITGARVFCMAFQLLDARTGVFYLRPWFRFDSIMAGCVLALVKERSPLLFRERRVWFKRLTNPIGAFIVLGALGYFEWERAVIPWSLAIQTMACVAILAGIAGGTSRGLAFVLRRRPITFLGKVSYSLYLWQQLFIVTKVPDWGFVRQPFVDVIFTFACALLSWYLIERPFLRLKAGWSGVEPQKDRHFATGMMPAQAASQESAG